MQNLGLNFILNDETCTAFYRNLVRDGADQGYAVISTLTAGDEVVATLLGIRNGTRYVARSTISNADDKWSNCSPGRLIIERTMAARCIRACGNSISASATALQAPFRC